MLPTLTWPKSIDVVLIDMSVSTAPAPPGTMSAAPPKAITETAAPMTCRCVRITSHSLQPGVPAMDRFNEGEGQSPSPSDPLRRGAPDGQQSLPVLRTEIPHYRQCGVTAYRRLTTPLPH